MTLDASLLWEILGVAFLAGGAYGKLYFVSRDVNRLGKKHSTLKESEDKRFLLTVSALIELTPHEQRKAIEELLEKVAK